MGSDPQSLYFPAKLLTDDWDNTVADSPVIEQVIVHQRIDISTGDIRWGSPQPHRRLRLESWISTTVRQLPTRGTIQAWSAALKIITSNLRKSGDQVEGTVTL
jgi:hypothetical protein